MADDPKQTSFWQTLPGILTAVGGIITAVSVLVATLNHAGLLGDSTAKPRTEAVQPPASHATPAAAPSPTTTTTTGSNTAEPPAAAQLAPSAARDEPQPARPRYVMRAVFYGDPANYFVTENDDIVGVDPSGIMLSVGRRTPPTVIGFAWMYQTPYITYGVDPQGRIWNRLPNGQPVQIGYIMSP
ncbi:hypothetical protein ABWL39_05765 [Chitinivorax sp. PXF-14]|uniref:hypothetical protein n=1 Tax=Chitinivorax sp. PXF-14 TaxID=3230488 RepID=UPI0034654302